METKLNNISIYNERMDKSIKDKLWFIDKVDANVYVDFGCANGNLLKHLSYIHQKQGKTDIQYIGYDNNDEMLKIARQNCNRFKNISFTNDFVILPKAPPIITPTDKSMMLPRDINSLNSFLFSNSFLFIHPPGSIGEWCNRIQVGPQHARRVDSR